MATAALNLDADHTGPRHPEALVPEEWSLVTSATMAGGHTRALPRLSAELALAKQNRRGFALVMFRARPGDASSASPAAIAASAEPPVVAPHLRLVAAPPFSLRLATMLRDGTRESDAVVHAAANEWCLVAMPDVTESEARHATRRLQKLLATKLKVPFRTGLALFPRDGHTLEMLVRRAERDDVPHW